MRSLIIAVIISVAIVGLFLPPTVDGYEILTTISVGKNPDGVELNPLTNRAYTPNTGSNSVSVIDTITNKVIATIDVGRNPEGVIVNEVTNLAYVANTESNSISVIDTTTNKVIDTIFGFIFPDSFIVNPDTNRLYVTNEDGGKLSIVDTTTNTVIDTIRLGMCPIDVDEDTTTNLLYVVDCKLNNVSVIDLTTNTVIDTIEIGGHPYSVIVDSDTNRVYATNRASGTVSVIDTTTNKVIDTIEVGKAPYGTTLNPDTNRAYVANSNSNTVSVIDTTTNKVIDTIDVGRAPGGIALNPLTNIIYVANTGDSTVSVIDLNTGEPVEEELPIPEEETPELPEQASEIAQNKVPSWIKNNAGWWAEGQINDTTFLQGIQFLIKEGIMVIPPTESSGTSESQGVPSWIKNNAGWWAEGQIDDTTFLQGIQFLIKNSIIIIEQSESIPKDDNTQMNADKILQTWGLTGCEREDDATSNWRDITYYEVVDGKIILDDELAIPNELKKWQVYDDKHYESWNVFTQVVPPQYMNDVVWFTIFTDGIEWLEMDVFLEEDSDKWSLLFDIQDWYCLGNLDENRVKFTMIHEFGHILSLGPSEIDVDFELRDLGWEEEDAFYDIILEKEQTCDDGIITTHGCAKGDSYINAFAQKFQEPKYSDSINFNYQTYSNEWTENLWDYYTEHKDEYVTDYAAASTQEDVAETFTFFILSEKPQGNSILEQKILFFYDYTELVEIRDYIRNNF